MSRAGFIQSSSSSRERKIEKLCMDAAEDRARFEEIANDPLCTIKEKIPTATSKGVLWLTVIYEREKSGAWEKRTGDNSDNSLK